MKNLIGVLISLFLALCLIVLGGNIIWTGHFTGLSNVAFSKPTSRVIGLVNICFGICLMYRGIIFAIYYLNDFKKKDDSRRNKK